MAPTQRGAVGSIGMDTLVHPVATAGGATPSNGHKHTTIGRDIGCTVMIGILLY